jgi:branched-chain amino acid transport system substrate-binding protein
MTYVRRKGRRYWLAGSLIVFAAAVSATMWGMVGSGKASRSAASPIRVAILSDCQGAFASNYEQDIGGAITALAQYAGVKPKNKNKPSAGWTGGQIGGHPLKLVGIGCSNDRADTAIKETRRLMEQLKADVMIGPLSGDESVAVANYAKQHQSKTFVNGTAGAWDTTAAVKAPNFFRFNGDGIQWNAGIGDLAYKKLKWRKAAIIMDDYSFGYASAAGMIADFCAAGGNIVKRVFPPLNATDYSSYARQLPDQDKVDGYFWAVGGTGTIPSLKAFEQAHGKLKASQVIGNLFFFSSGADKQLGPRLDGAYVGGFGSSPDLKGAAVTKYKKILDRWYNKYPPLAGKASDHAADGFTYNYYLNAWALVKALKAVKGDLSGGQKKLQAVLRKTSVDGAYGKVTLDKNRQAIQDQYSYRMDVKSGGALSIVTVQFIPKVAQSFGGAITKPPSRTSPGCAHKKLPWTGKEKAVVKGVVQK